MSLIYDKVMDCFQEVVDIRRDIHRHPEIGRKEVRTSALIREKLEEYGVDRIESPVPTAVVAVINGAKGSGKCVALRCDIDALPVNEKTDLPFSSENPGCAHVCGHDMHTAMLLGVAKVLCEIREQFSGCVKLIFQHSEDTLPGGAKELVEKGVLENPHVDAILGLHVIPDEEKVGQIGLWTGPVTTSVDLFDFTIRGKGGHGSQPQTTTDPILAAAQTIVLMQQIVARRINPMEMAVLSFGSIHGGDAPNVIPAEVKFSGVTRSYSEDVRAIITEQVMSIAKGMEITSGNTIEVCHNKCYPSAVNDELLVQMASDAVCAELGKKAVVDLPAPMAFSEDFSYYHKMTGLPSAYLILYAGHEGDLVSLHNPKLILKEEAMPVGMTTLVAVALTYLKQ